MKTLLLIALMIFSGFTAAADEPPPGAEITPPRLSFADGKVSFWRPGAQDWSPARVNTPLAAGDALYTGEGANLEIQVGPRSFVRAAQNTQIGIVAIEPDFLQVKVTGGHASLDLRSIPAGHTVELDTPGAVFTIEHPGYYRVIVAGEVIRFATRRGGHATITLADGAPQAISPSEEIVVRGTASPIVETYVAPEMDAWDRWNYARTDYEIEALSARYVSPGVYGVGVLDHWGAWRVVPSYGPVWVPDRVAAGWAPYTTGSWVWDPYYGWTWVDDAPWGWAPFHYGRWVFVDSFWAWAPGPVIMQPVYAPALVGFFAVGPSVSVRIGVPGPAVGWVALGWGEPLYPWWGRPGFIGVPSWRGWAGPRVGAGVVIHQHAHRPRAVVAVSEKQFGSGPVRGSRFSAKDPKELQHIRDAHPVRPGPQSLAPGRGETIRPPARVASRPVVTTRPPREASLPFKREPTSKPAISARAPRVVPAPKRADASIPSPRPSFGQKGAERPRPAPPPRAAQPPAGAHRVPPRAQAPEPRTLPGKPANGVYRQGAPRAQRGAPSAGTK